ncbi:PP2C family protein-serine/threonine phosphatase [Streptomyces thermoalcalitolerans]|uniref:SpoIIE family protein phosphatase n=1 Tax=Streptomyces thermoalcalitolerans TaxID=65605 RepID=A0ABP3ZJ63_9ACTN
MSDGNAPHREPSAADRTAEGPVLSRALAALLDEVHAHAGAVYLPAPGRPVLEMAVMAGLPRTFASPWERVGLNAPFPIAHAVRDRRLVWVGDEEEMARRYPRISVVAPYPFAMAALPLATGKAVYGAVFVVWPASHPPELSDWERKHLTASCDRLATQLEQAAAENRPVRPGPDLLTLDPADEAADAPGSAEAARLVARLPYGLVALDLHGRVSYANPAAADLIGLPVSTLLGVPLWKSVPWLNDPVYEDRYRAALISQRVTSFVALRPPGDWLSFRMYPDTTGLSMRISRTRAVEALSRGAPEPGAERTGLITISHVLHLAGGLTETVSVRDVVRLIADEIVPAVGGQALMILGSQSGRLHVLGHRGYQDPRVVEMFDGVPLTAPTPGAHVLAKGVPAFFESRQQMERLYPDCLSVPDGFAAWAYLPLIASGRPVGTCVLSYAEPHHFSTNERAVLISLGGLMAQALERARLYDAKHRLAHGLQQALLPHSLPRLAGLDAAGRYLPATQHMEIGGDFYDMVATPPTAAAVIGDVQGHNVTAAGLMGQLRTAVRAYTTVGQEPGEVMRSTNRLLMDLGVELFASCLYLRLDPASHSAVMSRAGHPPPLLRLPDGRVRVLDLAGGPLLGIDATAVYTTTRVGLAPGSTLLLYTDGLVESPETDLENAIAELGHQLGEAGDAPPDELADLLVQRCMAARERIDDVAVLLLRMRDDG